MNLSVETDGGLKIDLSKACSVRKPCHLPALEDAMRKAMLAVDRPKARSRILHIDRGKHHNYTRDSKRADVLLVVRGDKNTTAKLIADRLDISQSTSSARLQRMVVSGYLHCRTEDKAGFRRKTRFYYITAKGRRYLSEFNFPADAINE